MVLRDEENRVATRTFFVNEARGAKQPTVAWRALRGREATCGQAVLWGWELVRDVEPGDEVLTTYEEDASGMPETRPDERSGTADALASIGGVPRNLQGCGYLVATAPRRAGAVDRSTGVEDRHLQIAVRESLRDAKLAKLRVPGCACRDLETGQRCKATRGGGAWYTITFGDGRTASRRAEQLEPLEEPRPPSRAAPAAAPPPRRPPRRRRPRRPRTRRRSRTLGQQRRGDRARAAERGHPGAGRGGAIDPRRRSGAGAATYRRGGDGARRVAGAPRPPRRLVRGVRPRARRVPGDARGARRLAGLWGDDGAVPRGNPVRKTVLLLLDT